MEGALPVNALSENKNAGVDFLKRTRNHLLNASYVDLTDKDIIGGRESNLSLGLNWYLDEKFRVMANAIKVLDVDRPGSEFDGEDPLIFALRAQWLIY